MSKTRLNYWIDLVIAAGFVVCGLSGLILYLPISASHPLGLSFRIWSSWHTWSGFLMVAGVAAHLVLHWRWLVCMTKSLVKRPQRKVAAACASECGSGRSLSRRAFLAYGGSTILTACLAFAVGGALAERKSQPAAAQSDPATPSQDPTAVESDAQAAVVPEVLEPTPSPMATVETAQPSPTTEPAVERLTVEPSPTPLPTATPAVLGVACRKGFVNDPYPGRCHQYVDRDGDGICDLSVLGSGNNRPRGG